MGETNSNIEQPVNPMSRVEAELRGEDIRPMSRVEALLKEGGGGGSTVLITPTLSSGTKIADYSINGEDGALYAPDGGSDVEANPSGTATANLNKLQVGSTIYSVGGLEIIDTLEAGETELTIQDNAITTTATYDFFTDAFGVSPTDVEVTTGQIVLTFEEQESDMSVKVRIS
jgi:hypothetical protein